MLRIQDHTAHIYPMGTTADSRTTAVQTGSIEMAMGIKDVQASFGRCGLNPDFLDTFYKNFLASSPEIAALFKNTDFKKQKKMLQMSLNMLLTHAMGTGVVDGYMQQLAEKHSRRELNIDPRHYSNWLHSLVKTVKQFDTKFTPELEQAWRACLHKGIELMRAKY
jgi:hemoglobin-like flavoprotein